MDILAGLNVEDLETLDADLADLVASLGPAVVPEKPPQFIGASEIACILGLHHYLSPYKLWAQLHGLIPRYGGGNAQTLRGQIMEPSLRDWYAKKLGVNMYNGPTFEGEPWTRKDTPWQAARPDGCWMTPEGTYLLEVKTTLSWDGWGPEGTDQIPSDYACQIIWQQWVASDRGPVAGSHLIAFNRYNDEIRVYLMPPRLDLGRALAARAETWWAAHIVGMEPPMLDGTEATREALKGQHRRDIRPELEATPERVALVEAYRVAAKAAAEADLAKELARNRLVAEIGEARGITGLCTYKLQRTAGDGMTRALHLKAKKP